MLRMALIASLVLFNISVWVGPAEVLAARGKAMPKSSPQHAVAERFVMEGDTESAAQEYQALLAVEPKNATYHAEYAMLCFNNGEGPIYALSDSFITFYTHTLKPAPSSPAALLFQKRRVIKILVLYLLKVCMSAVMVIRSARRLRILRSRRNTRHNFVSATTILV